MSRDMALVDPKTGETFPLPEPFEDGGTYIFGGASETTLNITYNYSILFDFKALDGVSATDSLPMFDGYIERFGRAKPYPDYWAPTPGNVLVAVKRLREWAALFPGGVWRDEP